MGSVTIGSDKGFRFKILIPFLAAPFFQFHLSKAGTVIGGQVLLH